VVSRFAGRLVTGPLAFLVAGVIDVLAFVIVSAWCRAVRRLSGGRISAG
jgi:flagellar biogenesis protein FliO